ncbi:TPA: ATPase [Streptococcus pneumoniae]|uniref:hypothetical protein n=1 Tax=Streptococcus pneumoniae TaxID=1313 RepID=UPI0005DCE6D3|nr:hypothetical protein [Streptococcus pneumoniae]MDS8355862.1 ATPase [Streptococcus pneumoniae]MDS8774689.1 ATPase [Streptococcus pneumoniae]CEW83687.1 surface protein pspA precursor [Streptococcus pneumoniae]CEW96138.1 surface protein pspA precursor [Streptococcus pneumoniae]CEX45414.1 surface protein pspA precursor [Streptococcus pneumoniae]
MNNKNIIPMSLASVAILATSFVANQPVTVKAEMASTASASSAVEQAKSKVAEAEKDVSKGQEIYDEAQKKVQEKADVIRKIDEERQIINGEVQKAYLELRQAQEEKNKYPGRQEYTKKFNEANKKVDEITKKQKAKDEEYTKKCMSLFLMSALC